MLRVILWASLVGSAACQYTFELDERAPVVDEDDDGVADAGDNCPGLANESQADADGDGRGDACDGCDGCMACDRGADHDEDGDKLPDGCDNCPALANATQDNLDSDDLGDACDASPETERRLLFDGFGELTDAWLESGAQWTATGDDVGPVAAITPGGTMSLQHASVVIPQAARWAIEVGLVPLPPDHKAVVYIGNSAYCSLERLAGDQWQLVATTTRSALFTASFDSTIRLRVAPSGPLGAQFVECTIVGMAPTTDTLVPLRYPLSISLVAIQEGPRFRYVDVIAE